jgi:NAD+ diphosphatase
MLGFEASYVGGEPVAADGELEDARWFTRGELTDAAAERGSLRLPPSLAIARRLIDGWLVAER